MDQILTIIKANIEIVALAAAGISVVAFFTSLVFSWRTGRLMRRYNSLMKGMENKNLEIMLSHHMDTVKTGLAKTAEVEQAYKTIRKMSEKAVQNVAVVRFNAFNDTGSDLSYAVALLDHYGDGLVISSLFGRNETRTYAKPVTNGSSSYHLSEEEEEAIRKALNRHVMK